MDKDPRHILLFPTLILEEDTLIELQMALCCGVMLVIITIALSWQNSFME